MSLNVYERAQSVSSIIFAEAKRQGIDTRSSLAIASNAENNVLSGMTGHKAIQLAKIEINKCFK